MNAFKKMISKIKMWQIRRYNALLDIIALIKMIFLIRELSKTELWEKHNLRHDWLYRPYTVVNFNSEEILENETQLRRHLVGSTRAINEYLYSCNLGDFLFPDFKKIEDYNSFLVVYKPAFYSLTWKYFLCNCLIIYFIISVFLRYFKVDINSIITTITNFILGT